MSKEVKQLIKEAKQAFNEKQQKLAEEKCRVSWSEVVFFIDVEIKLIQ